MPVLCKLLLTFFNKTNTKNNNTATQKPYTPNRTKQEINTLTKGINLSFSLFDNRVLRQNFLISFRRRTDNIKKVFYRQVFFKVK